MFLEASTLFREQRMEFAIDSLTLNVAHLCQLQCAYCFASGGEYSYDEDTVPPLMDEATGRRAVDFFFEIAGPKHSVLRLLFFGGEPLINWDLIEILVLYSEEKAQAIGKRMQFSMTTNAMALDAQRVTFIREHKISLLISVDGDKELHSKLRPHKDSAVCSYEETRAAVALLKEVRPELTGRATVTKYCTDPRILVSSLKDMGFTSYNLQLVTGDKDAPWALDTQDIRRFASELGRMIVEGERITGITGSRISERSSCAPYKCNFSVRTLTVDALGRIYSCHRLLSQQDFYIGDVNSGLDYTKMQALANTVNANNMSGCKTCWAKNLCAGGCAAVNYLQGASLSVPNSYDCILGYAIAEASIERFLTELKAKPSAEAKLDATLC